eukprot:XP_011676421.1 PREDICTED: elongation of very long chain fatty acids protein 7 [Strongylocentrotus purpuratus]
MAQIIMEYIQRWDQLVEEYKDPRADGWLLMDSAWPGSFMVLAYLVIVWVGPKLMEKRQPFQLREVLIVYNFAMVLLSLYMVVQFFFILRKKKSQISFLHVFHHSIMPFTWWVGVRFSGGGLGTFHAFLNSFIHFLMYTYYGLAAFGPKMQKYLWWKKYMTKMQLIQFTVVLIHLSQLLFIDCAYPSIFVWIVGSYGFAFLVLFLNFYMQAYIRKGQMAASQPPKGKVSQNGESKVASNGATNGASNGDARNGTKTDSNSNGYHKLD